MEGGELKDLQHACWRALSQFAELAEVNCDSLAGFDSAPLQSDRCLDVVQKMKEESQALQRYLSVRACLIAALLMPEEPPEKSMNGAPSGTRPAPPTKARSRSDRVQDGNRQKITTIRPSIGK